MYYEGDVTRLRVTQTIQSLVLSSLLIAPLAVAFTPVMSFVSLSTLQQAIVKLCEEHDRNEHEKPGFRRCVTLKPYFIKYDSHASLLPQYKTQQYIYEKAVGDPSAPRIAKVYDFFSPEHKMAYLVMEYIDAEPTLARNAPEKVAKALQWLRNLPAPPDVAIGPVGGGLARHALFKDHTAPLPFSSKEALQRYMNRVCPGYCTFLINRHPLTVT